MKKVISLFIGLALMFYALFLPLNAAAFTSFYVSPNGSDNADGSIAHPFSTIKRAQEATREINQNATGDIYIFLRGGTYYLDDVISFSWLDSGFNGHRIIYTSFQNEKVTISGGMRIENWSVYDSSRNIWKAPIDTNGFYSRHLYVDGVKATRARSEGRPEGFVLDRQNGFNLPTSGVYSNMSSWRNQDDIEIHQQVQWAHQWGSVNRIENGKIYMDLPFWQWTCHFANWNIGMLYPDTIENAFELLDQVGEWYLDRTEGFLYYMASAGDAPYNHVIVLGRQETLIDGNSNGNGEKILRNVSFINLFFSDTTWLRPGSDIGYADHQAGVSMVGDNVEKVSHSAIEFEYTQDVRFENCTIERIGSSAIAFGEGCKRNTITGCTIQDVALNGISIGGIDFEKNHNTKDETTYVADNVITQNTITRIGNEIVSAVGIMGGHVHGLVVDHNSLSDLPYTAISVGWGWGGLDIDFYNYDAVGANRVSCNYIDNYMNQAFDGGGIYTLGRQDNSIIRDNVLHRQENLYAYLYLDNGTRGYTVINNVVLPASQGTSYWLLANDACGGPEYQSTHGNTITHNYFPNGMKVYRCPSTNTLKENWGYTNSALPTHAKEVIDFAGAQNSEAPTQRQQVLSGRAFVIYDEAHEASLHEGSSDGELVPVNSEIVDRAWIMDEVFDGVYCIVSAKTGRVLTPSNHSVDSGVSVISYTRQGTTSQYWRLIEQEAGIYKIQSYRDASICLSISEDGYLEQRMDNGSQVWLLESVPLLSILDAEGGTVSGAGFYLSGETVNLTVAPEVYRKFNRGLEMQTDLMWLSDTSFIMPNRDVTLTPVFGYQEYRIINSSSGKALAARTPEYDGDILMLDDVKSSDAQLWHFAKSGGYVQIVNISTGYVITPSFHSSTSGEGIIVYNNSGNASQFWSLVDAGSGAFKIVSKRNKKICLTPSNHSSENGTQIIQWKFDGNADQNWFVVKNES